MIYNVFVLITNVIVHIKIPTIVIHWNIHILNHLVILLTQTSYKWT